MRSSALFLTVSLFGPLAFPIGRIGNQKIIDAVDRYSAAVPTSFANVSTVDDGGLILASGRFSERPMMPVDIQVLPFKTQYPDLVGKNELEIQKFFFTTPAIHYDRVTVPNSALTLFGETSSSYVGVSVCSDGRGYVLFGPRVDLTKDGILKLLTTTVFDQPCQK